MEPIIKIVQPFSYVNIIKIYSPKIKSSDAVSFLVKIDDHFTNIDLLNDGSWMDNHIKDRYPREVFNLIVEEIQYKYV